jgi:hypothetical protein
MNESCGQHMVVGIENRRIGGRDGHRQGGKGRVEDEKETDTHAKHNSELKPYTPPSLSTTCS